MTEKSQNADSGKEKKRQYNNRKVFRRCRQTLINKYLFAVAEGLPLLDIG